jgi:hypothetical protein
MNDFTDMFAAARAATLPLAPRQALSPAFSADAAIREIHDYLCDLHYMAFQALYGPPPAGVRVRRVHSGLAGDALEPRYLATLPNRAGRHELAWLDSFAYGLDHWDEAAMANPCIFTAAGAGPTVNRWRVSLMPMAEVLGGAARRLGASHRWRELQNLSEAWRDFSGPPADDGGAAP